MNGGILVLVPQKWKFPESAFRLAGTPATGPTSTLAKDRLDLFQQQLKLPAKVVALSA